MTIMSFTKKNQKHTHLALGAALALLERKIKNIIMMMITMKITTTTVNMIIPTTSPVLNAPATESKSVGVSTIF